MAPKNYEGETMTSSTGVQEKDVVLEYRNWEHGQPGNSQFAHVDCLLLLSRAEKRDHPLREKNSKHSHKSMR